MKDNVRRLTRYKINYSLEDLLNVTGASEVENLPEKGNPFLPEKPDA